MFLFSYGTRPEYIKIKSILDNMGDIPYKVLFTGQHKTLCEGIGDYSIEIQDGPNRIDSIIKSLMNLPDDVFEFVRYVIVQGDTTSAMALAIASFNRGIQVIHLEAGLRTFDTSSPYPEEFNRQVISKIATIHFCPTKTNYENLLKENAKGDIYIVGNTGLDNIRRGRQEYNSDVIVTLHRRENHKVIPALFREINDLAIENKDLNFIIPLHPNPNIQKFKSLLTAVKIIDPLPHGEMIELISKCRFLISDSGGLQEEASFLNKKIIVCRENTERPESLYIHSFLCVSPDKIRELFDKVNNDYIIDEPCPYGDGAAYKKIIPILKSYL